MPTQNEPVINNMRARAEQCRRLAAALTDKRAAAVLVNMAEEVEADISRLEAKSDEISNPLPPVAND